MSKFKIGDKVRRVSLPINSVSYAGMRVGDTDTVVESNGTQIRLANFGGGHNPESFELVITYPNPPHKHADIIKAWADGAEVEFRAREAYVWSSARYPNWNEALEYRVKPTNPNADKISEIEEKMRKLADELKELKGE